MPDHTIYTYYIIIFYICFWDIRKMDKDISKMHSNSKYNTISPWTKRRHERIFKQIRNSLGKLINK